MTDLQFDTALKEALTYDDRDAFASDLALSSMWDDAPENDVPQQRIDELGRIWDIAHMTFADIYRTSGKTLTDFALHYHIPYRTVQGWKAGERECPLYLRLLLTRAERGEF